MSLQNSHVLRELKDHILVRPSLLSKYEQTKQKHENFKSFILGETLAVHYGNGMD